MNGDIVTTSTCEQARRGQRPATSLASSDSNRLFTTCPKRAPPPNAAVSLRELMIDIPFQLSCGQIESAIFCGSALVRSRFPSRHLLVQSFIHSGCFDLVLQCHLISKVRFCQIGHRLKTLPLTSIVTNQSCALSSCACLLWQPQYSNGLKIQVLLVNW